jgi:hypothetical protein
MLKNEWHIEDRSKQGTLSLYLDSAINLDQNFVWDHVIVLLWMRLEARSASDILAIDEPLQTFRSG